MRAFTNFMLNALNNSFVCNFTSDFCLYYRNTMSEYVVSLPVIVHNNFFVLTIFLIVKNVRLPILLHNVLTELSSHRFFMYKYINCHVIYMLLFV
jgi:hypothetical protein